MTKVISKFATIAQESQLLFLNLTKFYLLLKTSIFYPFESEVARSLDIDIDNIEIQRIGMNLTSREFFKAKIESFNGFEV
jgi:hypothetical protein